MGAVRRQRRCGSAGQSACLANRRSRLPLSAVPAFRPLKLLHGNGVKPNVFPAEFQAIVLSRKTNLHLMELGFDYDDPMCRKKKKKNRQNVFKAYIRQCPPATKLPICPTAKRVERVDFSSVACHPFCNRCLCHTGSASCPSFARGNVHCQIQSCLEPPG